MISELRPSIHHLGDQIIWVNSELAKGRKHFNVELTEGIYDLFDGITWSPDITRYNSAFELDFGCQLSRFNPESYARTYIPQTPYLTMQFDSTQIHADPQTPEAIAYAIGEKYKNYIIRKYEKMGYFLVDIGGKRFSLAETAYIMKNSAGHIGASSAFGVFSRCVGVPFTHIYYNCTLAEFMKILPHHYAGYVGLFSRNGMRNYFRDLNLNIEQ